MGVCGSKDIRKGIIEDKSSSPRRILVDEVDNLNKIEEIKNVGKFGADAFTQDGLQKNLSVKDTLMFKSKLTLNETTPEKLNLRRKEGLKGSESGDDVGASVLSVSSESVKSDRSIETEAGMVGKEDICFGETKASVKVENENMTQMKSFIENKSQDKLENRSLKGQGSSRSFNDVTEDDENETAKILAQVHQMDGANEMITSNSQTAIQVSKALLTRNNSINDFNDLELSESKRNRRVAQESDNTGVSRLFMSELGSFVLEKVDQREYTDVSKKRPNSLLLYARQNSKIIRPEKMKLVMPGNVMGNMSKPKKTFVSLSSLWAEKPVVIQFFKNFGCPVSRNTAINVSALSPILKKHNVNLAGIGLSKDSMELLIKGNFWSGHDLYVDMNRRLYTELNLAFKKHAQRLKKRISDMGKNVIAKKSKNAAPATINKKKVGATFVISKTGRILFESWQKDIGDLPDFSALLRALEINESELNMAKKVPFEVLIAAAGGLDTDSSNNFENDCFTPHVPSNKINNVTELLRSRENKVHNDFLFAG